MNYIYDILLNYNTNLYEMFEWNKEDNIIHIRKIPLFRISKENLYNFINKKVKLEDSFLSNIYQRTEMFAKNRINSLNYCFLVSDTKEVIALKCNHIGNIIEYSKLLIEEEIETLEYCENIKEINIEYEILENKKTEFLKTRNELQMKQFIFSEIKKIIDNNDINKLQYLYLDCFNKNINTVENINKLYEEIEINWENVYTKIYSLLKMTANKK